MACYSDFLARKQRVWTGKGLDARDVELSPVLYDWQDAITRWALRKGRCALFEDCGLGKTFQQCAWANALPGRVLMLAPLCVAEQTVSEAAKLGIAVHYARTHEEAVGHRLVITNYERLDAFDASEFVGVVLDESSILKAFDGKTRTKLIATFQETPYRLCCTATPAPNDIAELANHAEFLGLMTRPEFLATWFVHDDEGWRMKKHAVQPFYRWMASWALALRKPSDIGYPDDRFILPELRIHDRIVEGQGTGESLFPELGLSGIGGRLKARRGSLHERVDAAANIIDEWGVSWLAWCGLNDEARLLTDCLPGSVNVQGSDSYAEKVSAVNAFVAGETRILASKLSIVGYGMNFQHCHKMVFVGIGDCYDQNTDVLTRDGWKRFDGVSITDELATVNQESLALEWQRPERVIYEHYVGPMHRFAGQRNFDLLVTPNHKLFVQRCPTRYRQNAGEWGLRRADDLTAAHKRQEYRMLSAPRFCDEGDAPLDIRIPRYSGRIPLTARIVDAIPAESFMRLAGWYLSEGYCRPLDSQEAGRIAICQTDAHPDYRAEIVALLTSLNLSVNEHTKDITSYSVQLASFLIAEFGAGSRWKRIPAWVKRLHPRLLRVLRDTMMKGDGAASGSYYKSFSPALLDDFQQICIMTGWRASVHGEYVSIAHTNLNPSIHQPPTIEPYEGYIGCATVPNHTLIVRRNGIPVVSGNSFERYYQGIRRCWRFGQQHPVDVHIVVSDAEMLVVENVRRKEREHAELASGLLEHMRDFEREELAS